MTLRTIESLGSLLGRRILVRCDLNVPLEGGTITDDGRIRASVATLRELLDGGAGLIVMSHLGRAEGAPDPKYSLAPVAVRMSELLGVTVRFADDTVGGSAESAVKDLENGGVVLLENLRFHAEEEANDDNFAKALARLADSVAADRSSLRSARRRGLCKIAGSPRCRARHSSRNRHRGPTHAAHEIPRGPV